METIILKTYPVKPGKSEIVRLQSSAQEVIAQFQRQTGLSASRIASEIIRQAAPFVEFQEAENVQVL